MNIQKLIFGMMLVFSSGAFVHAGNNAAVMKTVGKALRENIATNSLVMGLLEKKMTGASGKIIILGTVLEQSATVAQQVESFVATLPALQEQGRKLQSHMQCINKTSNEFSADAACKTLHCTNKSECTAEVFIEFDALLRPIANQLMGTPAAPGALLNLANLPVIPAAKRTDLSNYINEGTKQLIGMLDALKMLAYMLQPDLVFGSTTMSEGDKKEISEQAPAIAVDEDFVG